MYGDWIEHIRLIYNMQASKTAWREGKKRSLAKNVARLGSCDASDPRDIISSVMGISISPNDDALDLRNCWSGNIDYLSTVEELYTSFARSMLLQGQSNEVPIGNNPSS